MFEVNHLSHFDKRIYYYQSFKRTLVLTIAPLLSIYLVNYVSINDVIVIKKDIACKLLSLN